MENNNKEIDLIELFIRIALFFKKHIILLVGSIVFGFVLTFIYSNFSTKLYKSHITVISINKQVFVSLLESLNGELNVFNISKSLNVSESVAKSITRIEPEILYLERNIKDETREEVSYFKIHVTVKDTSVFQAVEQGLQFFVENNEYFDLVYQTNNYQRNELIKYINEEINKLDVLRLENKNVQDIYIENKANLNSEIVDLFIRKQSLERTNKLIKKFRIIKEFGNVVNPISDKRTSTMIVLFISILGFLLSILLEIRIMLKKIQDN